jgi:hypothetical protein
MLSLRAPAFALFALTTAACLPPPPAAPAQTLACEGGSVQVGDQCACPDGTAWDGAQCAGAAVANAGPSCTGGAVPAGDQCVCPEGTAWNGAECVAVVQQTVIQQQSHTGTSSFTCCVNGARYTCPDDAAFRACVTMSPSHGCTRAGGC